MTFTKIKLEKFATLKIKISPEINNAFDNYRKQIQSLLQGRLVEDKDEEKLSAPYVGEFDFIDKYIEKLNSPKNEKEAEIFGSIIILLYLSTDSAGKDKRSAEDTYNDILNILDSNGISLIQGKINKNAAQNLEDLKQVLKQKIADFLIKYAIFASRLLIRSAHAFNISMADLEDENTKKDLKQEGLLASLSAASDMLKIIMGEEDTKEEIPEYLEQFRSTDKEGLEFRPKLELKEKPDNRSVTLLIDGKELRFYNPVKWFSKSVLTNYITDTSETAKIIRTKPKEIQTEQDTDILGQFPEDTDIAQEAIDEVSGTSQKQTVFSPEQLFGLDKIIEGSFLDIRDATMRGIEEMANIPASQNGYSVKDFAVIMVYFSSKGSEFKYDTEQEYLRSFCESENAKRSPAAAPLSPERLQRTKEKIEQNLPQLEKRIKIVETIIEDTKNKTQFINLIVTALRRGNIKAVSERYFIPIEILSKPEEKNFSQWLSELNTFISSDNYVNILNTELQKKIETKEYYETYLSNSSIRVEAFMHAARDVLFIKTEDGRTKINNKYKDIIANALGSEYIDIDFDRHRIIPEIKDVYWKIPGEIGQEKEKEFTKILKQIIKELRTDKFMQNERDVLILENIYNTISKLSDDPIYKRQEKETDNEWLDRISQMSREVRNMMKIANDIFVKYQATKETYFSNYKNGILSIILANIDKQNLTSELLNSIGIPQFIINELCIPKYRDTILEYFFRTNYFLDSGRSNNYSFDEVLPMIKKYNIITYSKLIEMLDNVYNPHTQQMIQSFVTIGDEENREKLLQFIIDNYDRYEIAFYFSNKITQIPGIGIDQIKEVKGTGETKKYTIHGATKIFKCDLGPAINGKTKITFLKNEAAGQHRNSTEDFINDYGIEFDGTKPLYEILNYKINNNYIFNPAEFINFVTPSKELYQALITDKSKIDQIVNGHALTISTLSKAHPNDRDFINMLGNKFCSTADSVLKHKYPDIIQSLQFAYVSRRFNNIFKKLEIATRESGIKEPLQVEFVEFFLEHSLKGELDKFKNVSLILSSIPETQDRTIPRYFKLNPEEILRIQDATRKINTASSDEEYFKFIDERTELINKILDHRKGGIEQKLLIKIKDAYDKYNALSQMPDSPDKIQKIKESQSEIKYFEDLLSSSLNCQVYVDLDGNRYLKKQKHISSKSNQTFDELNSSEQHAIINQLSKINIIDEILDKIQEEKLQLDLFTLYKKFILMSDSSNINTIDLLSLLDIPYESEQPYLNNLNQEIRAECNKRLIEKPYLYEYTTVADTSEKTPIREFDKKLIKYIEPMEFKSDIEKERYKFVKKKKIKQQSSRNEHVLDTVLKYLTGLILLSSQYSWNDIVNKKLSDTDIPQYILIDVAKGKELIQGDYDRELARHIYNWSLQFVDKRRKINNQINEIFDKVNSGLMNLRELINALNQTEISRYIDNFSEICQNNDAEVIFQKLETEAIAVQHRNDQLISALSAFKTLAQENNSSQMIEVLNTIGIWKLIKNEPSIVALMRQKETVSSFDMSQYLYKPVSIELIKTKIQPEMLLGDTTEIIGEEKPAATRRKNNINITMPLVDAYKMLSYIYGDSQRASGASIFDFSILQRYGFIRPFNPQLNPNIDLAATTIIPLTNEILDMDIGKIKPMGMRTVLKQEKETDTDTDISSFIPEKVSLTKADISLNDIEEIYESAIESGRINPEDNIIFKSIILKIKNNPNYELNSTETSVIKKYQLKHNYGSTKFTRKQIIDLYNNSRIYRSKINDNEYDTIEKIHEKVISENLDSILIGYISVRVLNSLMNKINTEQVKIIQPYPIELGQTEASRGTIQNGKNKFFTKVFMR
jgi:hypothetical protein